MLIGISKEIKNHEYRVGLALESVARTATYALNNTTLAHAISIADKGWKTALSGNGHLANSLNVAFGQVAFEAAALHLGYEFKPQRNLLN